jgi:hypothetical protein
MGSKRIKAYLILRFGNLSATNDAGPLNCSEEEQIIVDIEQGSFVKTNHGKPGKTAWIGS